ncbi:protein adenylyltransferase SelO [Colwellia sp. TT2012]|uniref:protein adenylyltransferase SelO n=1 Tax=Colwellia sp. TT2012 TaxID=1720342 RepID=UPI00070E7EDC|nr:YdiU family protein [Colwellia sp. TT2012]
MPLNLTNSYSALGPAFSQQSLPTPVAKPSLLLWNQDLANELSIDFSAEKDSAAIAQYFSGNKLFSGSEPIAQAYSGHQFGHFNPQLGDGRAHLLGDLSDKQGQYWDVQLKGSGTSFFSRQGDGRCALGPALREYIMSEAMFALGVPTTRCLAVVATGEAVYREQALPGAVVTRIATSHIRVGTFQYFSARNDIDSLKKLTSYAIERHFPQLKGVEGEALSGEQIVDFFAAVIAKQVTLVVSWLRVGFIHGVMNTDNTAISGETIDYGPCAMMNHYHSDTVFSSIDRNARYAFGNQSKIMHWNMARLADCLLPLIDEDEDIASAKLAPLLQQFTDDFKQGYFIMMANKLGIAELEDTDHELINDFLGIMAEKKLDYSQSFVTLAENLSQEEVNKVITQVKSPAKGQSAQASADEAGQAQDKWQQWLKRWYIRISADVSGAKDLMAKTNPLVIPRNHHVEAILATSQASYQKNGDLSDLNNFLAVLQQPYTQLDDTHNYQDAPSDGDENYHTFCGT